MREILIAIGVFGLLVGIAWARSATMMQLVVPGLVLVAAGLIVCLPFSVWYHVQLYRALSSRGVLEKRWIWNATRQFDRLLPEERGRVMPSFYVGVAGFVVVMLGVALMGLGTWVGRTQ